jgi:glutamyl-Q tRNA(Asp) synthetase
MLIRTRFAPSPTGFLHLGHVFAAKIACGLAHSSTEGEFLLRHEDIDHSRIRPQYLQAIEEDLLWLNIRWNREPLRQSQRSDAYHIALHQLREKSYLYPCFCTRKKMEAELAVIPAAPHPSVEAPYPGTCRKLSPRDRQKKIDMGMPHSWRLDAHAAAEICTDLSFHDLRFGIQQVDPTRVGDVILARKDIGIAYHLAVVVDDAYQQISHVTRGEDLLASTPIHRVLQHLLEIPTPIYLHHPLVVDEEGKRLAKRHQSLAIRTLREQGLTPADIDCLMKPWFERLHQPLNLP